MPGAPLSQLTEQHLATLFAGADREEARTLLREECGSNLPLIRTSDPVRLERFRFAALKLSGGDLEKLRRAIRLAKRDWRDLLVAADFANSTLAHLSWTPDPPQKK